MWDNGEEKDESNNINKLPTVSKIYFSESNELK